MKCSSKKKLISWPKRELVNKMSGTTLPKDTSEEGVVEEGLMRLKLPEEETDADSHKNKSK